MRARGARDARRHGRRHIDADASAARTSASPTSIWSPWRARCRSMRRIVIMDEPTAALSPEGDRGALRAHRTARRKTARPSCSSATSSTRSTASPTATPCSATANMVGKGCIKDTSQNEIVQLMVGRAGRAHLPEAPGRRSARRCSTVTGLSPSDRIRRHLASTCARARSSASTAWSAPGAARSCRPLFGITPAVGGTIALDGKTDRADRPPTPIDAGIVYVPEERGKQGVVIGLPIFKNVSLPSLAQDLAAPASCGWPRNSRWRATIPSGSTCAPPR